MKAAFSVCLLMLIPLVSLPQRYDEDRNEHMQQIIEMLSENLEAEDLDMTTLLEDLFYLLDHPISLNRASAEDFRRLPFLSEFQIQAILDHKALTGRFMSHYELQGIAGLDQTTIAMLLPFVKVNGTEEHGPWRLKQVLNEGGQEAFVRVERVLEQQAGYAPISDSLLRLNPNSRYAGSPDRVFMRYRFSHANRLSFGVTAEKDAGEAFGGPTQPRGFDFYSAHLFVGQIGILKKAVIGDYQAQFGQGLTYWSGLAFGKSSDMASIKRNARGITPYVSADENNFMRGAAATVKVKALEATGFVSYKAVDANIVQNDSADQYGNELSEFSAFQLSGLHATPSQIEDKDALKELNTGGHLRYEHGTALQIGVTTAYTQYSREFSPASSLYRQFEPVSNGFLVSGFDYQLVYRNVMAFGENSFRWDGGYARLNGAIISLDQNVDVAFFSRYYSASYNVPRSNAVSESSRNINEAGTYMGMSAKMRGGWRIQGYADIFSFPWLRFGVNAPTSGAESLVQLEYRPTRKWSVYARIRTESKGQNKNLSPAILKEIADQQRTWYRFNWQWDVSNEISLRGRVEYTHVVQPEGDAYNGWLVYQDLVWKPPFPARYSIKLRYALFDTDNYDSRLYAYEHDLLYAFSVPAYYDKGSRAYAVFQYNFARWGDFSARIAQTFYANRQEIGSGLNGINGPVRTQLKIQVRIRL